MSRQPNSKPTTINNALVWPQPSDSNQRASAIPGVVQLASGCGARKPGAAGYIVAAQPTRKHKGLAAANRLTLVEFGGASRIRTADLWIMIPSL